MKKRRVKRRLKVGRLILVIVLGIGLAISTYFGIKYLLKSNNDKPINKPSEEEKEKAHEIAGRCSDHRNNRNRGLSGRACVTDN